MSPCIRIGAGICGKSCTSSGTGYIIWTAVILHQVNCLITEVKSSGNSALYYTRILCSGHVMSPCIRIGAGICGKSCNSSGTGYIMWTTVILHQVNCLITKGVFRKFSPILYQDMFRTCHEPLRQESDSGLVQVHVENPASFL